MAQATGAMDTYEVSANREDLSDIIYDISPEETIFVSSIGKRSVSSTKFEWQVEDLPAISTTAIREGDVVDVDNPNNSVRRSNMCQILRRSASVTGTQQAVNRAGVSDSHAHATAVLARAMKRDVESVLLLNQASNESSADASTARLTAGMGACIMTNVDKASDGSNPTAFGTDARNDGTARTLNETILKSTLKLAYDNANDQPNMIIVDSANKQIISGFAGRASATSVVALPGKGDEVQASVAVYIGDFGTYNVHTSRHVRASDGWIINPEYAKVAQLRPYELKELDQLADSKASFLIWEGGLQVDNEKAHALMADLGA
tara:strand:+ start:4053 stop:5012 length:960 start_codon:yes stop_codon:yes gene_type:complete